LAVRGFFIFKRTIAACQKTGVFYFLIPYFEIKRRTSVEVLYDKLPVENLEAFDIIGLSP